MNIYCFSTLSFAKLQFKSVINKVFHKHGVASFTDAWIETFNNPYSVDEASVASFTDAWIETFFEVSAFILLGRIFYRCVDWNTNTLNSAKKSSTSHLLQMRGLKHKKLL